MGRDKHSRKENIGNLGVGSGQPKTKSQHKGNQLAPEGQRSGIKTKTGDKEGEGKENTDRGEGAFFPDVGGDKGLPLGKEEVGVAHRQRAVYRGKKGNPMLG